MPNSNPAQGGFGALPTFGADIASTTGNTAYAGDAGAEAAASTFSTLSKQLGGLADTAAQDEGARAGKVAGLDPNYRPDDSESIRGRAFRNAAVQTYTNTLEANTRQTVSDAYSKYMALPQDQRDPNVLRKTLGDVQQGFLKEHVFPEIQGQFQNSFSSLSQTYLKAAEDDHEKRTIDQAKASLIQNTNAAADTAHRLASIPGPEADKEIATSVVSYNKLIDDQVNQDVVGAAAGAKLKEDFKQGVLRTRTMAIFQNLPEDKKAAFADNFGKSYATGADTGSVDLTTKLKPGLDKSSVSLLQPDFRDRLGAMIAGAPEDIRDDLTIGSGFRSGDRQAQLWQNALAKYGSVEEARKWVAPPGGSQHEKGFAVDLHFDSDEARQWAHDNASKFGLAFPLGNEPWHVELQGARTGNMPAPLAGNRTVGLSPDSFDYLQGQMHSQLRTLGSQQRQAQKEALGDIDTAQKQITAGYDVPESEWSQLTQKYAGSADPDIRQSMQTASDIRTMFASFKGQPPAKISADLANVQSAIGPKGYTSDQVEKIKAASSYLDRLRTDLQTDPIGRAARDGVVAQLQPIDATSPETIAQSLNGRVAAAEQTAQHYGLASPTYLRPDEKALFKSIAAEGGPRMVAAAGAVVSALGPRADAVLKEIGGDAPQFASMARLASWNASPGILADLGERQRLNNDPTMRSALELPQKNASDTVFTNTYGDAMAAIPAMGAAARVNAKNAYEVRALRGNLDRAVGTAAAQDTLTKSAQEVVGATYDGETQYGGVGTMSRGYWHGSQKVLAPLTMKANEVGRAIGALTDKDLSALPSPPVAGDGKTPIGASAIAGGYLTSVAHGVYQVSLQPPTSKDPQYVQQPNGKKFLLDLNALAPIIRARAPDLYRQGQ